MIGTARRAALGLLLGLSTLGCSAKGRIVGADFGPPEDAIMLKLIDLGTDTALPANEGTVDDSSVGDGEPKAQPPEDFFQMPLDIILDVPVELRADDDSASTLLGPQPIVIKRDDLLADKAFERCGIDMLVSAALIRVDPAKRYRVSGRFRSVGTERSRIFFGVAPYTVEPRFITVEETNRLEQAATIVAIDDPTKIVTADPLEGWSSGMAHQRILGFYYDGDTNRLPDWVWRNYAEEDTYSMDPSHGAFSSASGTEILLNATIPAEEAIRIVPGTKVMNHSSGGTYLYTAAADELVPVSWTPYEGTITDTSFSYDVARFRPGTEYARLLLLANWSEDNQQMCLHFTSLKIEEVVP